jgi:hypothetical protein
MYNDIKAVYDIRIVGNETSMADMDMNQQFYEENATFNDFIDFERADSSINEQFYSEQ